MSPFTPSPDDGAPGPLTRLDELAILIAGASSFVPLLIIPEAKIVPDEDILAIVPCVPCIAVP